MTLDAEIRPATSDEASEQPRRRNWFLIALVSVLVAGAALIALTVLVHHTAWYHNRQVTQYLKAHGIVTTPVATIPGSIDHLTMDADGSLYALSVAARTITVVHPNQTQSVIHIPVVKGYVDGLAGGTTYGIANDAFATTPNGTSYVIDAFRSVIMRVSPNGSIDTSWMQFPQSFGCCDLYSDARGNLYAVGNRSITRITSRGVVTPNWANLASWHLSSGWKVTVGPTGVIYVAGANSYTPSGATDVFQVQPGRSPQGFGTYYGGPAASLAEPPTFILTQDALGVDGAGTFWAAAFGGVLRMHGHGHVASWWLTNSDAHAVGSNTTLLVAGRYGYAAAPHFLHFVGAQSKPESTTILRFALPTGK